MQSNVQALQYTLKMFIKSITKINISRLYNNNNNNLLSYIFTQYNEHNKQLINIIT